MNLSQIIERKKEEFDESDWIAVCEITSFSIMLAKQSKFLEKAIRESVEEALREVIVFKKTGTMAYMQGYEDALKDLYVRVKEFMK